MIDSIDTKEFGELSRPRQIGPWRLIDILGRGGMGIVYLAERRGDDAGSVALKLADSLRSRSAEGRLAREVEILATLEHPNIARVLDHGEIEGKAYLAIEYVDGPPIDRYVEPLELRDKVRCFHQVCAALEYSHRRGIIHRDLKPSNILVNVSGEVKVLDFGAARWIDSPPTETSTTPISLLCAAPEQFTGGAITEAVDIYALGLLLHQCVTGRHPFHRYAITIESAMRAVLEAEPDALEDPGLNRIVRKAMRKTPEERYGSVAEMAYDLGCWLAGRFVAVPRVHSLRRIAFRALAVVLLMSAAGAGAVTWKQWATRQEHRRKVDEIERYLLKTQPDGTVSDWAAATRMVNDLVPRVGSDKESIERLIAICNKVSNTYMAVEPRAEFLRSYSALAARLAQIDPSKEGMAISGIDALGWKFQKYGHLEGLQSLRAAADRASHWKPVTLEDCRIAFNAYSFLIESTNSIPEKRFYGQYFKAVLQNPKWIEDSPGVTAWILCEAELWDDAGRVLESMLVNENALPAWPSSVGVHNLLARVRKNQGRYEEALAQSRESQALLRKLAATAPQPGNEGVVAHLNGEMLDRLGRRREAEPEFQRALRIRRALAQSKPDDVSTLHELSSTLYVHARMIADLQPRSALREVCQGLTLRARVHTIDRSNWRNHLDWELPDLEARIEAGLKDRSDATRCFVSPRLPQPQISLALR